MADHFSNSFTPLRVPLVVYDIESMRRKRLLLLMPRGRVQGTLILLTSLILTIAGADGAAADHGSRRLSLRRDESTGSLLTPETTPDAKMERVDINRELQQSANLFAPKESQMETMQSSPKISIDGSCVGSTLQAGQQRGKGGYLWCVFAMHTRCYEPRNLALCTSLPS